MKNISERRAQPSKVVKFPPPDTLLSPEEFSAFLLQDIANLDRKMKVSWMCLLAYSVSQNKNCHKRMHLGLQAFCIVPFIANRVHFRYLYFYKWKKSFP